MALSKRAQSISPSPTLGITARAKALREEGIDIIGFGAGEPDFDTPEHIKQEAIKALSEGGFAFDSGLRLDRLMITSERLSAAQGSAGSRSYLK